MSGLTDAIINMRQDDALTLAREMLANGSDPLAVLNECKEAMDQVGKYFEEQKYFIPELILAGDIMADISEEIKPLIKQENGSSKRGKVILGTVEGDIHDIGKDIVAFMLDINGFEVYDLGVDVPAQTFVDKVAEIQPQVVALSGFLTLAFDSMKDTVAALADAGLRDGIKIMVGGGTVDDHVRVYAEADGYGFDAMTAVSLAKQWTEE